MINEDELAISNKSYVNKDFASIYPELVDMVKNLTDVWDPETSNESDPGVVLLKLAAFIADKLNYNVDKNVLECFMPSATQESSMRKLCDMMGYEMGYYNSATTNVTISYVGEWPEGVDQLTLKPYETTISSTDGRTVFTLVGGDVVLSKGQPTTSSPIRFAQGSPRRLYVAGNDHVQLNNLDSLRRVYFPIRNVAQNGVLVVSRDDGNKWNQVRNMNTADPSERNIFKFGYDSDRELPYIEFPEDIAELIGSGLNVLYLETDGRNGNVRAGFLTKLQTPSKVGVEGSEDGMSLTDDDGQQKVAVFNVDASIDGSDPESIDSAYSSFKRTIGTFDTLVTCRDYANYIYGTDYVSNVQVADRRDDINYSRPVVSLDEYGPVRVYWEPSTPDVTAYDLMLYPLKPVVSYTEDYYRDSFLPLDDYTALKYDIEDQKCVSHDYKSLKGSDIYLIKNYAKVSARLSTTYKVDNLARADIIKNVRNALIEKFNAREVDYGFEIPFDSIVDVINNADERISSVSLYEPELATYIMDKDGVETELLSGSGMHKFAMLVAKNVLAGKLDLFDRDDRFEYELGQSLIGVLDKIGSIHTEFGISLDDNDYVIGPNESVVITSPSLIDKATYSYGVMYKLTSGVHTAGNPIAKDAIYQLASGESLTVRWYEDSSSTTPKERVYSQGDIIVPNFELTSSDGFDSLGARETITNKVVNEATIGKPVSVYWIRNNAENRLFTESDWPSGETSGTTVLGDGEYVFYTDLARSSLVSLGNGTKITTNLSALRTKTLKKLNYKDVIEQGLLTVGDWYDVRFDETHTLNVLEQSIITLSEGDSVGMGEGEAISLGNDPEPLNGLHVHYTIAGEDGPTELQALSIAGHGQEIRTRYDINSGRSTMQTLGINDVVDFKRYDYDPNDPSTYMSLQGGDSFYMSDDVGFAGSDSIDASYMDIATGERTYPLSVYAFKNTVLDEVRAKSGLLSISADDIDDAAPLAIDYPGNGTDDGVLCLYWDGADGVLEMSAKDSGGNAVALDFYNSDSHMDAHGHLNKGLNTVSIDSSVVKIEFKTTVTDTHGVLSIGVPTVFHGLNPDIGVENFVDAAYGYEKGSVPYEDKVHDVESEILGCVKDNGGDSFYYTSKVDMTKGIETDDMTSPYSFYDRNNVANKFTLTELDLLGFRFDFDVDVVRSSRKQ